MIKQNDQEKKLENVLNSTEAAMDELKELLQVYNSRSAAKIHDLLSMAFDLIDDEQQIMCDYFGEKK